MAAFDWVPYLNGKYLTYYQWFATIFSAIAFILALLCFVAYLIFCKITQVRYHYEPVNYWDRSLIQRLQRASFNLTFFFLTLIPLFWAAFDGIYLIEGFLGMVAIQAIRVYL